MLPLFIPAKNPARKQLSAVDAAIRHVQFLIGGVAVNIVTESLCPVGGDVAGHVVLLHGLVQVGLGELAQYSF